MVPACARSVQHVRITRLIYFPLFPRVFNISFIRRDSKLINIMLLIFIRPSFFFSFFFLSFYLFIHNLALVRRRVVFLLDNTIYLIILFLLVHFTYNDITFTNLNLAFPSSKPKARISNCSRAKLFPLRIILPRQTVFIRNRRWNIDNIDIDKSLEEGNIIAKLKLLILRFYHEIFFWKCAASISREAKRCIKMSNF